MTVSFLVVTGGEGGFEIFRNDEGPPVSDEVVLMFQVGLAIARLLYGKERDVDARN